MVWKRVESGNAKRKKNQIQGPSNNVEYIKVARTSLHIGLQHFTT